MVDLPRRVVLAAVLGGCWVLAGAALAGEEPGSDPVKLMGEAVEYFDQGDLARAREKLDQLVKVTDENVAAKLVERAGVKTMIDLLGSPEAGRGPKVIWELYSKYYRRRLTDAETIRKLVAKCIDEKTPEPDRFAALHELRRVGQYAVPTLAKHLTDQSASAAYARIALTRIGSRGVLAMAKLLDTGDDQFKMTLAQTIGDIQPVDQRAVPALKRLYDSTGASDTVKGKVAYALHKVTGLKPADMSPYEDYYYLQANRLYMEAAGVPEEAMEADGVIWELKDGQLVYRTVPVYSWNEEMAEDLAFECLRTSPKYDRMFPLVLSIQLAQQLEVAGIQDAIKLSGAPPTMNDGDHKILSDRAKLMADTRLLAQACGPRYLYRAVGKALRDGRNEVAAAAMDLLPELDPRGDLLPPVAAEPAPITTGRKAAAAPKSPAKDGADAQTASNKHWWQRSAAPAGGKPAEGKGPAPTTTTAAADANVITAAEVVPEFEGLPLIEALDSPDDGARVAGAVAIAKMDPPRPFAGSEKVVAALADAISKAGPLQILVAEENDDAFKELKGFVEEHGWGVTRATSGRDTLAKAGAFPPVDLVLLSTKLKADMPAKAEGQEQEDVLGGLAKNRMTALIPVALLIDKSELVAEQARFGNKPMIARGTKGRPLAEDIISALGSTGPGVTKQKREALAARAANALLEIDPRLTQMLPADCAEACHNAVKSSPRRPDDVRNPCLRAIGLFKVTAATADVAGVFSVKENTVEVRRNSLYALGEIAAAEHRATFLKAQHDEADFSLRNEAAVAYGKSQLTPEPEKVTEFAKETRLPRTNDGGDGRSDALKGTAAPAGDAAPAAPAAPTAPAAPAEAEAPAAVN